jgi:YVTN family beta-propeller protein
MKNNRKNCAIALALPAEGRTSAFRRTTLLTLAAAGIAAAFLVARPAAGEPAVSGFVYTADEHGGSISRIDVKAGKTDVFPIGIMPHNVQFVPGTGRLLAVGVPPSADAHGGHGSGGGAQSNENMEPAGKLLVLDAANLASGPITEIAAGSHPAHVITDAAGKRAFVTNSDDDSVSVIDPGKGETVATIHTGDYPHGLRMSPDSKSVYVANVKDDTVSVIDTVKLSEIARVEVGLAPVQVGFVPDGSRVYVSLRDENKVAVIDTATREVIGRIDVGRSPIQVHATPDGRFVYVANQGTAVEPDDTVSVIEVASGKVIKTVRTGAGAHGVTVSADGAFVFVSNIIDGTVSQISVESQAVVETYPVGNGPNGITFQPPKPAPDSAG